MLALELVDLDRMIGQLEECMVHRQMTGFLNYIVQYI
jgi:hypothetical protein